MLRGEGMPMTRSSIAFVCGLLFAIVACQTYGKNRQEGASQTAMQLPSSLEKKLRQAQPGDIVRASDFSLDDVPLLDYNKKSSGPPMVFSDDPEYFRVPEGAGVREVVGGGHVRLYLYHVNATTDTAKRISAVIENLGDKPLTLTFERYASRGPSADYYKVGKSGLIEYLSGTHLPDPIVVPVRGAAPIDIRLDKQAVRYDELVHGFYDFHIDQPARITTLITSLDTPSTVANARIGNVLPPRKASGAGRGLYPTTTFAITPAGGRPYDTADGPRQILIADGKHDPWITGHDSSRNTSCTLAGNYGVIYNISIPFRCSDGRGIVVGTWYPPSGKKWCDACALAVKVNSGAFEGGVIPIPRGATSFSGRDAIGIIQRYDPGNEGSGTIEITYSPPGASCLPTPLLLLPISKGESQK